MVDDIGSGPQHLLAMLDRLNTRIGAGMAERLTGSPVRRGSEGRILSLVSAHGSRPTDLAAGAWITKQAVGKRIQGLAERGLVRLEPDPDDGRAVLVHRTPAGERAKAYLEEQIADLEDELAARVGKRRYREFRAVLDELAGE